MMASGEQHIAKKGGMVQIISVENPKGDGNKVKPIFYGDRLTEVIKKGDVDDYLVVSIIGPKRSGKSFLTNFMICHLRELEKKPCDESSKWLKKQIQLNEVNWAQSREAVTKGIWIWNELFFLEKSNRKYGILLMDCQGLFDPDEDHCKATDTLVTLFALELSNIHILNLKGDIKSTDLEHLETSITFAKSSDFESKADHSFNTLLVVHRDWDATSQFGIKEEFFSHMKSGKAVSKTINEVREAFKSCYEFMLPAPGRNIQRCSADKKNAVTAEFITNPDSEEFLECAVKLNLLLFMELPGADALKHLSNREQLTDTIQRLDEHFGQEANIPSFGTPAEVLAYGVLNDLFYSIKSAVATTEGDSIVISQVNKKDIEQAIQKYIEVAKEKMNNLLNKITDKSPMIVDFYSHLQSMLESEYAKLKETKCQQLKEHQKDKAKAKSKTVAAVVVVGVGAAAICAVGGLLAGPAIVAAPIFAGIAIEGGTAAAIGAASWSTVGFLVTAKLTASKIKKYFYRKIRHSK